MVSLGSTAPALFEVDRCPPLLVHDPDFDRVACKAQAVLDTAEQLIAEHDFLRAVHLGFDDVDAAAAAVPER
jgi:hypothetical protein